MEAVDQKCEAASAAPSAQCEVVMVADRRPAAVGGPPGVPASVSSVFSYAVTDR